MAKLSDPSHDAGSEIQNLDCDENEGVEAYTYSDEVKETFVKLGVGIYEQPKLTKDHESIFHDLSAGDYFDGRLPTVIRQLTLDQISALYSLFSNWHAYLQFQTGLLAVDRSEALRQKEFLWSHIRNQKKIDPDTGKKMSDQQRSDAARVDYRFVHANALYEKRNLVWSIMAKMCEVAEQDMKVISREVTIHQAKAEQGSTGRNIGVRAGKPQTWTRGKTGDNDGVDGPPAKAKRTSGKPGRVPVKRG